jgi:magnesium transporter
MSSEDSLKSRIVDDVRFVRGNIEIAESDGFSWIDVYKPTRTEMDALAKSYNFHILNVEDSLTKNQFAKIDRYEDYVFVILLFPVAEKEIIKSTRSKSRQLSVFVGKNYLVTIHQGDFKPLTKLFELCKRSDGDARKKIMGKSAGYLFHGIIDVLIDELLHMTLKVIGNLDDIEKPVFDESVSVAREIARLRREITVLKHSVNSLKRVIPEFGSRDAPRYSANEIDDDLARYYADVNDHIAKVAETLDEAKEKAEIFKDIDFMLGNDRSNKILEFLTVVFTLFIPTLFLGTIYGMNIGIPGTVQSGTWTFWGPHTTLIIVGLMSLASVLAMLGYFRRMGWFTAG